MPIKRRMTVGPMPVDISFQPNASPRINIPFAELVVDKPNPNAEFLANRDMRAALEANPQAARRLARNRALWIVVPLILIAGFLVLLLLI